MKISYLFVTIAVLFICQLVFADGSVAQTDTSKYFSGKVKVTAGKEYDRSGLTEVFLGAHWRDLWTTPFDADVLNLDNYAGGLTPYKRGGGLQTKSLRFKGKNGKTYKFRSIDKDPRRILPPDLQETIFADAFKDQISTSHPFAAIIVAPMLNQLGILNAEPIVVVMPDDNKLGEFKKDFGNVLGTFEENPDDGSDGDKGFGESDKIVNSFKLYNKLEKDNDNQVDKTEFLKARLLDLLIGDWDRHSDQWLWAGYKQDGKTIYKPIPRDRDQAFCLYDGLLPYIVGQSITQIEGYSKDYPKIYDLSFNGRYLDRRFLPGVKRSVYDSLTKFIQTKLTNDAIRDAVRHMPDEWYKKEGKHLEGMIRSRRDNLKDASDEFYELINETADIYGSNKPEYIDINNVSDGKVKVEVYKMDKSTGEKKGDPFFSKTFSDEVTSEIRIYTNKGRKKFNIHGNSNSGIDILAIGDESKMKINKPGEIKIKEDIRPKNDPVERFEPKNEDRGYDWRFGPGFGYNTDDGLIIGGGPILYKYDYGVKPYSYRMSLIGSYAFSAKSYSIKYTGDFYSIIKNTRVFLDVQKTELAIKRFFGEGNETPLNKDLDAQDFYKVGQELILVSPMFEYPAMKKMRFSVAPFYKFSDVSYNQNTYLGQYPETYGIGAIHFAGFNATATYDTRDNEGEPYKGVYARLLGNYTPNIFQNNFGFSKAGIDFRAYVSTDTAKGFTFCFRGAGGKVWGNYPFYESMFLGGANSLKGFSRERFAGDGVVLGQTEARWRIGRINILIPGMFGISLFGGTGRVYLSGETSKRWHSSYGGSLWITYLNRMFNVGFTAAKSDEGFKFFFGSAFFL